MQEQQEAFRRFEEAKEKASKAQNQLQEVIKEKLEQVKTLENQNVVEAVQTIFKGFENETFKISSEIEKDYKSKLDLEKENRILVIKIDELEINLKDKQEELEREKKFFQNRLKDKQEELERNLKDKQEELEREKKFFQNRLKDKQEELERKEEFLQITEESHQAVLNTRQMSVIHWEENHSKIENEFRRKLAFYQNQITQESNLREEILKQKNIIHKEYQKAERIILEKDATNRDLQKNLDWTKSRLEKAEENSCVTLRWPWNLFYKKTNIQEEIQNYIREKEERGEEEELQNITKNIDQIMTKQNQDYKAKLEQNKKQLEELEKEKKQIQKQLETKEYELKQEQKHKEKILNGMKPSKWRKVWGIGFLVGLYDILQTKKKWDQAILFLKHSGMECGIVLTPIALGLGYLGIIPWTMFKTAGSFIVSTWNYNIGRNYHQSNTNLQNATQFASISMESLKQIVKDKEIHDAEKLLLLQKELLKKPKKKSTKKTKKIAGKIN